MKNNSLTAAKLCYNEAIDRLTKGYKMLTSLDDKTIFPLLVEISMIFGNLSLVHLKQGDPEEAYKTAHQSIGYNSTAKVTAAVNA